MQPDGASHGASRLVSLPVGVAAMPQAAAGTRIQ
jgi:hypothetical protein